MDKPNLLNTEAFLEHLKTSMNEEMILVAEPIIQEALEGFEKEAAAALKKVESEMRKKLGGFVIGLMEHYLEAETFRDSIRITIRKDQ